MRDYELVAIISPEVDEDGVSEIVEKVTKSVNSHGGEVEEVKKWGRRKLAYPIDSFMEGEYLLARLKLAPNSVRGLEEDIGASGDILRYLMVKVDG